MHSLVLQMDGIYADSACQAASGYFHYFHPSRIIASMRAYRNGKKQGLWLSYYSDGLMSDSTAYDQGSPIGMRCSWYHSGDLLDSANYHIDGSGIGVGWFDNGSPSFAGRYASGYKKFGKWQYFYKAGGLSAIETYDLSGKLLCKSFFNEKGTLLANTSNDDRRASFPGGQQAWSDYLGRVLYFPDLFKFIHGEEATVVVKATIGEDGVASDAAVEIPFILLLTK